MTYTLLINLYARAGIVKKEIGSPNFSLATGAKCAYYESDGYSRPARKFCLPALPEAHHGQATLPLCELSGALEERSGEVPQTGWPPAHGLSRPREPVLPMRKL